MSRAGSSRNSVTQHVANAVSPSSRSVLEDTAALFWRTAEWFALESDITAAILLTI